MVEQIAGRFRILKPIGRGSMGEVHLAADEAADTAADTAAVAVKLIRRTRSGAEMAAALDTKLVGRFLREIEILRMLDHPNLPRLVDGGLAEDLGGLPYLAMEYLDGDSLAHLLPELDSPPVPWAAAVAAQVAAGLSAAHRRGVVHRDIKPSNIMVLRDGRVKLLDFGLGRVLDAPDASRLTSTGVAVGTAAYMAPEQVEGKAVPASDLYALGCVLYKMLTGEAPFTGSSSYTVLDRHVNQPATPIRMLRGDVPAELADLVARLLAKDPADRPASVDAVREALLPFALAPAPPPASGGDPRTPLLAEIADAGQDTPRTPTGHPSAAAPPAADGAAQEQQVLDVFALHANLIDDYRAFTEGGTLIRDPHLRQFLADDLAANSQWPDPWLSLNPTFASGGSVDDLVAEGVLHPECGRIFRVRKPEAEPGAAPPPGGGGRPMTLYRHQREAIDAARSGGSYVLTTGTSSGKSLSYLVPIVDRVLRARAAGDSERRVRAIIVYPMNALVNSQTEELEKYLVNGYGRGREPVTFARYTGQESAAARQEIQRNPPDILLTNYVMLELLLTRPDDRKHVIENARGLEFLVFDELHTYRGRQGADVAMLIRRVREDCHAPEVTCVGTSATMASEDQGADPRALVAQVASALFGTDIPPERVIGETLVRATHPPSGPVPRARITAPTAPRSYADLVRDPLAGWIESTLGLAEDPATGRLVRQAPHTLPEAAEKLAQESGMAPQECREAIRRTLEAGAKALHPATGRPLFAFRLHQFLSRGDTIHVTLEDEGTRHRTRNYQVEAPGSDGMLLFPLAFCRECGQEYLSVWREDHSGTVRYSARRNTVTSQGPAAPDSGGGTGIDRTVGYLYVSTDLPWPSDVRQAIAQRRIPDSWLENDQDAQETVRASRLPHLPRVVTVDPYGVEGRPGVSAAFVPDNFRFCLRCGVTYEGRTSDDFAKLATLDQEGRSSATSVISASIVRSLDAMRDVLDKRARKLLTFVDNRQDAALQAGHFNDFVQNVQLRGALYRAVRDAGEEGLRHEELPDSVLDRLGLTPGQYAVGGTELLPGALREARRVFRDIIAFRLYRDLERGWRITMPNLEQTGLLRIDYEDLAYLARQENHWVGCHAALAQADPATREDVARALLDTLRRALALQVEAFAEFDRLKSSERITASWRLEDGDRPEVATAFTGTRSGRRRAVALSGRSGFGSYLRRHNRFPHLGQDLSVADAEAVITDLVRVLANTHLLEEVHEPVAYRRGRGRPGAVETGYRVPVTALVWRAGNGTAGVIDPVRRSYRDSAGPQVNTFFRDLYQNAAATLAGLHAAEHTAQVVPEVRRQREESFREGDLKLLYCSPTMELGVDIAELNAVSLRNVPPTPANYAQRSGRAGRSGQPALVTTYCSTGNSHDQYYFRHSDRMVAGSVVPPRLDLANEDLIRSHLHAIWLAETGLKLGSTMTDLIDVAEPAEGALPGTAAAAQKLPLPLLPQVRDHLADEAARQRAIRRSREVLRDLAEELNATSWWDPDWAERTIHQAEALFDAACNRWRWLYRAALADQAEQNRRRIDHTLDPSVRERADRRRRQAETQLALLTNDSPDSGSLLADFTPHRYLASEGFLPGYSFPRLPVAAYVYQRGRYSNGDFVQRPRFLAIREFGPGALIYHEGTRFQVDRIQLPSDASGNLAISSAKRCDGCGYHHDAADNDDKCRFCAEDLPGPMANLLQLTTVYTKPRERISSDEEERRRAGFRLVTSYRFADHGPRSGRLDAVVEDADGDRFATLAYGDSATVRITNLGRSRAARDETDGFNLDQTDGRWVANRAERSASGDSGETPLADEDQHRVIRVLPFVEDRRNILVLQSAEPMDREAALSVMYALERGVETAFQLEDAELTTELLTTRANQPTRILFTESAEGGAGVLRRLQAEPDALARAAAAALDIAHFDRDGTDLGGPRRDRPCARGCYDCLLTYANQMDHAAIDRHRAAPLLLRLAHAHARPAAGGETPSGQYRRLSSQAESGLEQRVLAWLRDRGHRLPDEMQTYLPAAQARPDFVYRLPSANVAVFVDGPVHGHTAVATRDAEAEERLLDLGWQVIRFPAAESAWAEVVRQNQGCFGPGVAQR